MVPGIALVPKVKVLEISVRSWRTKQYIYIYIYPIAFGQPATAPRIDSIKVHMYWLIEGEHVLAQGARFKG